MTAQVQTKRIHPHTLLSDKDFRIGVMETRAGVPFNADRRISGRSGWAYEYGRQFGIWLCMNGRPKVVFSRAKQGYTTRYDPASQTLVNKAVEEGFIA